MRYKVVALIASVICGIQAVAFSFNVRTTNELFLEFVRLSTKYDIALPQSFWLQPLATEDLDSFFMHMENKVGTGALSRDELFFWDRFVDDLYGSRSRFTINDSLQDRFLRVNLRLTGTMRAYGGDSADFYGKGTINPRLSGRTGPWSFYSEIEVFTDGYADSLYHRSNYEPYNGVPFNLYGRKDQSHIRSSDMPRGGVRYQGSRFSFDAGVDYLRMGPALFNPVTLSGQTPPIAFARMQIPFGDVHYSHLVGQLRSQNNRDKFLFVHRLTFPVRKLNLDIGINEAIVYGSTAEKAQTDSLRHSYYGVERTIEWPYVIPFVPFKFAEQFLGDRDNGFVGADIQWHPPQTGVRLYGEILLDDILAPWSLFTNDWGNKYAFVVGGNWTGMLGGYDGTIHAEYSRVEPWVYTHFYGGSHNYANFGMSLGAPLGPNSDALIIKSSIAIKNKLNVGLAFTNTRKNSAVPVRGGNITDVWQDSLYVDPATNVEYTRGFNDSKTKQFLGKGTVRSTVIAATMSYAPYDLFSVRGEVGYDFSPDKHMPVVKVEGGFSY